MLFDLAEVKVSAVGLRPRHMAGTKAHLSRWLNRCCGRSWVPRSWFPGLDRWNVVSDGPRFETDCFRCGGPAICGPPPNVGSGSRSAGFTGSAGFTASAGAELRGSLRSRVNALRLPETWRAGCLRGGGPRIAGLASSGSAAAAADGPAESLLDTAALLSAGGSAMAEALVSAARVSCFSSTASHKRMLISDNCTYSSKAAFFQALH